MYFVVQLYWYNPDSFASLETERLVRLLSGWGKVDNILTTFYMYFYVLKCTEMHFCKNKKTLENIRKSNIFKGFSFGGEGEI